MQSSVCLGSGKLADQQEVHTLPAGDSNLAIARFLDADSLDVLSAVSSLATSDPFSTHLQQAHREIRKFLLEYPDILSSDGFSASKPK